MDEVDTLVQAGLVVAALRGLGYKIVKLQFTFDLNAFSENLSVLAQVFIF